VPFALTAGKGRPANPAFQVVGLMTHASLEDLAPVIHMPSQDMLRRLQDRGYKVNSTHDTPDDIATASTVTASEVLFALMPPRKADPERK